MKFSFFPSGKEEAQVLEPEVDTSNEDSLIEKAFESTTDDDEDEPEIEDDPAEEIAEAIEDEEDGEDDDPSDPDPC